MKKLFIYRLKDPFSNRIRYIGATSNIDRRYKAHCSLSRNRIRKYHCAKWLTSILSKGKYPIIEIIEILPLIKIVWNEREKFWIDFYKKVGCDLTNFCEGGFCKPTYGRLGKKNSIEHIQKSSQSRKDLKLNLSEKHKLLMKEGREKAKLQRNLLNVKIQRKPHSEETKEKIAKSHIGKKMDDNFKEKARQRQIGVPAKNKKQVECEFSNKKIQFDSISEASQKMNIKTTSIINCLKGLSKTSGGFTWKYL